MSALGMTDEWHDHDCGSGLSYPHRAVAHIDEFQRWMQEWHRSIGGRPADGLYSFDTVRAAYLAGKRAVDPQRGDRA